MTRARGAAPRCPRAVAVLAMALVALIGLAAWLALRDGRDARRSHDEDGQDGGAAAPAATAGAKTLVSPRALVPVESDTGRSAAKEVAADGLPYMPAHPLAARPDGAVHPHPITPRHLRIARENALLASLSEAMDLGDATRLRAVLDTYRQEYPEDDHRVQSGYQAIVDCLQHPGSRSRAAAQYVFDHELASTLRRFVKRICLE